MFYYVILCSIMFYYVLLCSIMFYYAILCYIMFYYVLLCSIMLYYVILCSIMFYYVLLCYIMFHYVLLCSIMFYYNDRSKQAICQQQLYFYMPRIKHKFKWPIQGGGAPFGNIARFSLEPYALSPSNCSLPHLSH